MITLLTRTIFAASTLVAAASMLPARARSTAPCAFVAPSTPLRVRHAPAVEMLERLRTDLVKMHRLVHTMRAVALKAANGTLTPTQRMRLDRRFQRLKNEIHRIGLESESNGVRLMDGSQVIVELQVHPSRPQRLTFWLNELSLTSLQFETITLTSVASAIGASVSCDSALDVVETVRTLARSAAQALGA